MDPDKKFRNGHIVTHQQYTWLAKQSWLIQKKPSRHRSMYPLKTWEIYIRRYIYQADRLDTRARSCTLKAFIQTSISWDTFTTMPFQIFEWGQDGQGPVVQCQSDAVQTSYRSKRATCTHRTPRVLLQLSSKPASI